MYMKKKGLALLLAFCMMLTLFPFGALADSDTRNEALVWSLSEDGVLTLSGEGEVNQIDLQTYLNENPDAEGFTSLVIESGITGIGAWAFQFRHSLEYVSIAETVSDIGYCAFSNCSNLESVVLSNGIFTIGDGAFEYCANLREIEIPDSVATIGDSAFYGCHSLQEVVIPNSVVRIGNSAFENCEKLISITFPDSITYLEGNICAGCTSLRSVVIPDSVESIGNNAFKNCRSLREVRTNARSIDSDAFYSCESLTSVTFTSQDHVDIGWHAFSGCTKLTSVEFAPEMEYAYIENYAFQNCVSLQNITFPKEVSGLCEYSFVGCTGLKEIVIPGNWLNTVSECAFKDCTSLESVEICGNSVNTIDNYAFLNCTSLKTVTLPRSMTTIKTGAFRYCDAITDVYYGGTESQWADVSIKSYNDPILNAEIHAQAIEEPEPTPEPTPEPKPIQTSGVCGDQVYWYFDANSDTLTISGEGDMWDFVPYDPENFAGMGSDFTEGPGPYREEDTEWITPQDGITIPWIDLIPDIRVIEVDYGVTRIGMWAFAFQQNLYYVQLPESVTSIGAMAFHGCINLSELNLPSRLTNIDVGAFSLCKSLQSIAIPQGVTAILGHTFRECPELRSITLPAGITEIGYRAFDFCDLDDVYFNGSSDQWSQIAIDEYNDGLINAALHIRESLYPALTEPITVSNSRADLAWLFWRIAGAPDYTDVPSPFKDTPSDPEYYSAIVWARESGTMVGYNDSTFCPDGKITRAEAATHLVRLYGIDYQDAKSSFDDVPESTWYYNTVSAFASHPERFGGYSYPYFYPDSNYSTITYDPNADYWTLSMTGGALYPPLEDVTTVPSTRMDIVWLMWRIAGAPDYTNVPSNYVDIPGDPEYYSAIMWATGVGITTGTTATTFSPYQPCTRAQLITFIWRYSGAPEPTNSPNPFVDVYSDTYYYRALMWGIYSGALTGEYSVDHFQPNTVAGSISYDPNHGTWVLSLPVTYEYEISDDAVRILRYTGRDSDVAIPETIAGYPVAAIAPYAFYQNSVSSISIPSTVTNIEPGAFAYCRASRFEVAADNPAYQSADNCVLTKDGTELVCVPSGMYGEYTVPAGVTRIAPSAFEGSTLTNVTLPEGVAEISENAFANAYYLEELYLPSTLSVIGDYALSGNPLQTVFFYGGQREWSHIMIGTENTSLDYANIVCLFRDENVPEELSYIIQNDQAIITSLDSSYQGALTIPEFLEDCPVVAIKNDAFYQCEGLTDISLPDSITEIGISAFRECSGLKNFVIPGGVTRIAWSTFEDCANLRTVTIPRSVTFIDIQAFDGTRVSTVIFGGTDAMWDDVIIKSGNDRLYRAVVRTQSVAIVAQPKECTAPIGGTVLFEILASGEGLTYQWQYSDDLGETWNATDVRTSVYTATMTEELNGRLMRCVVTDSSGASVISDRVMTRLGPVITSQPTDYVGTLNSTATFTVEAVGDGLTYQWQYSDDGGSTWGKSTITSSVYTAKLTSVKEGRMVRCIITDKMGSTVISDPATMRFGPMIISQPEDYVGAVGSVARFSVGANGDGLTYQWQYSDDNGETWGMSTIRSANYSAALTAAKNGRMVRCVITNWNGASVTSDAARMLVNGVKITTQPTDYTGAVNSTAKFTVAAVGDGLTYKWQYSDDNGATWLASSLKSATYSAKFTADKNGRMVRCIVTDRYGNSVTSDAARMQFYGVKLNAPLADYVGAVNSTARFTVDADGSGLTYQWQYSDDNGATWLPSSLKTAVYSAKLTAEKDGRLIRCIVTDENGSTVTTNAASMKIK